MSKSATKMPLQDRHNHETDYLTVYTYRVRSGHQKGRILLMLTAACSCWGEYALIPVEIEYCPVCGVSAAQLQMAATNEPGEPAGDRSTIRVAVA